MDEVFKIKKDKERAEDLLIMAKERIDMVKIYPKDKPYRIIEEYYEIAKELLTSVMYIDGFKTLSHVGLLDYFNGNYLILDDSEIKMIDSLRKFRHGIVYYGKKISGDFLINHEKKIVVILNKLVKLTEKKLG